MYIKSIKFKIVLYSTICLLLVGIFSNIFLYSYSNKMLSNKVDMIDQINIDHISSQIDTRLSSLNDLSLLITNNTSVQKALEISPSTLSFYKATGLNAQKTMTNYIDSSLIEGYIKKAVVFNYSNVIIQSLGKESGYFDDYGRIVNSNVFKQMSGNPELQNQMISTPVLTDGDICLPILKPIFGLNKSGIIGWLYIEVDLNIIRDILDSFNAYTDLFITTKTNHTIASTNPNHLNYWSILNDDSPYGKEHLINSYDLDPYNWTIHTTQKYKDLNIETKNMLYLLYMTLLISLLTGILIFTGMSNIITKPINLLKERIQKISAKDFSYDAKTANLQGELGEIGQVINEMAGNIKELLHQTVEITNEKKNFEISMLQSQVNPHFLYNTLNSIHWMASIQKNTGICNLIDALTNLLKNMANSFADKVTLREELKLLDDYITIQSIRYMESFELINNIDPSFYHYHIVKMTLQPLVENAIFHGITPKGKFGTIVLDAQSKDGYMLLTVTDDGVGMTQERILNLKEKREKPSRASINGIGLYNVDSRLRLIYGEDYGLDITSKPSEYTTITIKIPLE